MRLKQNPHRPAIACVRRKFRSFYGLAHVLKPLHIQDDLSGSKLSVKACLSHNSDQRVTEEMAHVKSELRQFYETGNLVNEDPLICVFEDFLAEKDIKHLLAAAQPELQRALVSDNASGVTSPGRSGRNCWIPHNHDQVIHRLCTRVADVVGIGLERAESLQVVHYAREQAYAPHFDAWDPTTERGQRCLAKGGQRMVTCLFYLNEPGAGGGTCFPNLDLQIRARKGRMLLFHNCHAGAVLRHPDALHGGMPVELGEKWACNLWFRERELRPPKANPARQKKPPSKRFRRVI